MTVYFATLGGTIIGSFGAGYCGRWWQESRRLAREARRECEEERRRAN